MGDTSQPAIELKDIVLQEDEGVMLTAAQVAAGPVVSPIGRLRLYTEKEWEAFTYEWALNCAKPMRKYKEVQYASGANDMGIDVAAFKSTKKLKGIWDNYQCKHYDHPLMPTDVWVELGKVLWHSFNKHFKAPRAYYFVAPQEVGSTLAHLLGNAENLKAKLLENWVGYCRDKIGATPVPLEGKFAKYVDDFDFSIFRSQNLAEMLEQLKKTPHYIKRFGGGLPLRPKVGAPPTDVAPEEAVYVSELFKAYGSNLGKDVPDLKALAGEKKLSDHFKRQRENFYHAESLRVFVRDKVEPGTFESLQEEIFHGVVDISEATHDDGYACVVAVTKEAQDMPIDAHPLAPSTFAQDRRGICHQLANDKRLKWTK